MRAHAGPWGWSRALPVWPRVELRNARTVNTRNCQPESKNIARAVFRSTQEAVWTPRIRRYSFHARGSEQSSRHNCARFLIGFDIALLHQAEGAHACACMPRWQHCYATRRRRPAAGAGPAAKLQGDRRAAARQSAGLARRVRPHRSLCTL